MRPDDVRGVAALERAVFGGDAWPAAAFAHACALFAASGPPRGRFWVATVGGSVAGYAGLEVSALGGEADLVNLAVAPCWRRVGLGRRLVGAAAAFCRRRRVPLLWLRVRASNRPARAFYRRAGFRPVGRFDGYYEAPREPAVLMARILRAARPEGARRPPGRRRPAPRRAAGVAGVST
jgi:ribosomal protein S18 acetylase RimI-like enzyme